MKCWVFQWVAIGSSFPIGTVHVNSFPIGTVHVNGLLTFITQI